MDARSRALLPSAGTVDVWRIALDVSESRRAQLLELLDDGERRHAERLSSGGERWAVARASRREILARCCGIAPRVLRFELGSNGKPRLTGYPAVHFNTSSRGPHALLAISGVGHVGVDIERDDVPGDVTEVARRFLPAEEAEVIVATSPEKRARRFAISWTRYEAVRKLWGLGIDEELLGPAGVATVREISVPHGFVAAVAAEGDGWSVRMREATEVIGVS